MLSPIDQERQRTERWRKLALQFDAHRIQALALLRTTLDQLASPTGVNQAAIIRRFLATPPDIATHQHVKRGSQYVFLGYGKMQAEDWYRTSYTADDGHEVDEPQQSVDMREVAIYRAVEDGSLWVRPKEEWEDGRFIKL